MEECLAIKPDLIFLWDEAWFGFARFSPFLRPRTAMGAANDIEAWMHDPQSIDAYEKHRAALGDNPSDDVLLNTRLLPDPRQIRLRVYQTNSTHKSMSAIRQGSMLFVKDVDFHTVEAAIQRSRFHPRLDQSQPATDREPRRCAPADGAGRIRAGRQRHRDRLRDPQGGRRQSADLEIFQRARRRQDGAGTIPLQRLHRLPRPGRQLGTGSAQPEGGRVLPRSDPPDAGLRHRRFRRNAVQGNPGQPLRNPGQQDLAQFRADPVQHQQYPQRRRSSDSCAGRDQRRDRARPEPGRRQRRQARSPRG